MGQESRVGSEEPGMRIFGEKTTSARMRICWESFDGYLFGCMRYHRERLRIQWKIYRCLLASLECRYSTTRKAISLSIR